MPNSMPEEDSSSDPKQAAGSSSSNGPAAAKVSASGAVSAEEKEASGANGGASGSTSASACAAYSGTNEDRERQEREIDDIINSRPPVGELEDFTSLEEELKNNECFSRKMPDLKRKYSRMRRIRGDGSCFFRGLIFRLMEVLLQQRLRGEEAEFERVQKLFNDSLAFLVEQNYEESRVKPFWVDANAMFQEEKFPKTVKALEDYFDASGESMYLVWYCRLLCAGYIKHDWDDRFSFFVTGSYTSAVDFCAKEVEPTQIECEQIQIIALCEYLNVRICVEYLDASTNSDTTTSHTFGPEDRPLNIYLLYRPGHYDVIYARED